MITIMKNRQGWKEVAFLWVLWLATGLMGACSDGDKEVVLLPEDGNSSLTGKGWDGETYIRPGDGHECKLKDEEGQKILHIGSPEQLAWCMKNGYPSGYTVLHICRDLDMGGHVWDGVADIPQGMIVTGINSVDDTPHCILNVRLQGTAPGLFGNSADIQVMGLKLQHIKMDSQAEAAGILVGQVKGPSLFHRVTVTDCTVQAQGVAGGMVGQIGRIKPGNRSEKVLTAFVECQVNHTTVSGTGYEGGFVGRMDGYDPGEMLSFDSGCSAVGTTTDDDWSDYRSDNQSAFLPPIPERYDGWLGGESYRRGVVLFDGIRLVPKWDGRSFVDPMMADRLWDGANITEGEHRYVVYSPYDLAGVRQVTDSPMAVYLKTDVDMAGQGVDGLYQVPHCFGQSGRDSDDDRVFQPFNRVCLLDGANGENNFSIYNLCIRRMEERLGAFILSAGDGDVHRNVNFVRCQTVTVHRPVSEDAKAYGAGVVADVNGSYTMQNIHAEGCRVFALQKIGVLAGRMYGNMTMTGNSVTDCYIENYECPISERFSSGEKTVSGWTVEVYTDFYPQGEVGGMIGFIHGSAALDGCRVNGTRIHAYGQDDRMAEVRGDAIACWGIATLGYYKVPGRHVATLVGDIRATGPVTIDGCGVDDKTVCTARQDRHGQTGGFIGRAYYIKFVDTEGSVTVDGRPLTVADCNKNTQWGDNAG